MTYTCTLFHAPAPVFSSMRCVPAAASSIPALLGLPATAAGAVAPDGGTAQTARLVTPSEAAALKLAHRYAPIAIMLWISGQFASKDRRVAAEPINTEGVPFILTLIGVTILLTALAFLPFLIVGPFIM